VSGPRFSKRSSFHIERISLPFVASPIQVNATNRKKTLPILLLNNKTRNFASLRLRSEAFLRGPQWRLFQIIFDFLRGRDVESMGNVTAQESSGYPAQGYFYLYMPKKA
jgi:hypothetical protein